MKTLLIIIMVLLTSCAQIAENKKNREIERSKPKPTVVVYYISGEIDTIQIPNKDCGFMEDASNIILNDKSCLGYYCCIMTQKQRDAYFVSIACNVKRYELIK